MLPKFLRPLETPGGVAILAGVVCYASAFSILVLLPSLLTNQDDPAVVGVDGVARAVSPYTDAQARGRDTYGKQVCWHCHSQFVRPVNDEDKRWGPVSQTGEYAFDLPHFFGTRRIGPDLHREGLLRVDDWHFAHFFNPRFTVPHSVMPGFTWLFDANPRADDVAFCLSLLDTNGDGVISTSVGDDGGAPPEEIAKEVARARTLVDSHDPMSALDRRGIRRVPAGVTDSTTFEEAPESGDNIVTDYDGGEVPNEKCVDLVTYLQRLGTNIGMWRRPALSPTPPRNSPFDGVPARPKRPEAARVYGWHRWDKARVEAGQKALADWTAATAAWDAANPLLADRLAKGKTIYTRHCAGCHGDEGRGNGSAARFFLTRPRDFTVGKYRYRSTPVGIQPLDGDLYHTIVHGLSGTAMPTWRELSDEQIWLLVDYVKSLYEGNNPFNDRLQQVPTTPEHFDTDQSWEILRGRAVYLSSQAQCYLCHGLEGRADGSNWNSQANNYGAAMRPRDFRPRLKDADAPELYALMAKKMERAVGADAWKELAKAPAWVALDPTDDAKKKAFVLFVLGEGQRVRDVFGKEAVDTAFGDRAGDLFKKGDEPLESIRMAVATEKDQPALRMRAGASSEELYRTVLAGLDGTAMKATYDSFFERVDPKRDSHPKEGRFEKAFEYVPVNGREVGLGLVAPTDKERLKTVGAYEHPDKDGKPAMYIKLQPGDDWALVHYLQWLLCVPRERTGN